MSVCVCVCKHFLALHLPAQLGYGTASRMPDMHGGTGGESKLSFKDKKNNLLKIWKDVNIFGISQTLFRRQNI